MANKDIENNELEFFTIHENSEEQERIKRQHIKVNSTEKENRRIILQRREGIDRRDMIRFEDDRREQEERRKGVAGWDTL